MPDALSLQPLGSERVFLCATSVFSVDPETNALAELFHPRRQGWKEHFEWKGIHLAGKTAAGRTTIRVLNINSEDQLALRSS
jgi:hypothetical protein